MNHPQPTSHRVSADEAIIRAMELLKDTQQSEAALKVIAEIEAEVAERAKKKAKPAARVSTVTKKGRNARIRARGGKAGRIAAG